MDELLTKGAVEPLPQGAGAGFYFNVFVVHKCPGGLRLILSLKQFNCDMHIPAFKMSTIRQVQQLIEQGDHAFVKDPNS